VALIASSSGNLEVMQYLHSIGLVDVEEKDKYGLLGANQRDVQGMNAALMAVSHGHLNTLKYLHSVGLLHAKQQKDAEGRNIALITASRGKVDVLQYLLDNGLLYAKAKDNTWRGIAALSAAGQALEWLKSTTLA